MDTLAEINEQIGRLYNVDDSLSEILEHAGRDYETIYTGAYLDMLEDVKALKKGLHALLDNYTDVIMDIEYALEPLPIKPIPNQPAMDEMAEQLPPEKTNLVEFSGKLIEDIRKAQVRTSENLVIENLKKFGL